MKALSWPHVVVIGIIVAGLVALAAFGRDTSALVALGTLLLAGIGLIAGTQFGIKDQTNGNTSRLLAIVEAQGQLLAQMQPPAIEQPPVSTPVGDLPQTEETNDQP